MKEKDSYLPCLQRPLTQVIDRGPDRLPGLPRYHLSINDLNRVQGAMTELQLFLQQAARLIKERQSYFFIDPGDMLLPILAGTSSLGQMNAAWKALRLQIELGTKAWRKYVAEYRQASDNNLILSPLSTLPDLYNELEGIEDSNQKLRYLFTNVPHHQQQLSEEGRTSLQKAWSSWVHVLQMPASIRNVFCLDNKTTPKPTPSLQMAELPQLIVNKGKVRDHGENLVASSIPRRPRETDNSKDKPSHGNRSIWMGMDTPFKSVNAWFTEPGKSNRSRQEGTSSQQTLIQDVLLGIATPQPYALSMDLSYWRGREMPLHMPSSSNHARNTRMLTEPSRVVEEKSQEQDHHDKSPHQPSVQNVARNQSVDEGPPPDGGDNDGSSSSHGSH